MEAMTAISRIAQSDAPPPDAPRRSLVMLHGIYGRGRNWQSIAKSVVAARPEYQCFLVDLPHHGDSGPGAHGDTVMGLAADLDDWLAASGIVVDAVLGHSFGGKVALAFAKNHHDQPLHTWVIDSTPDARAPSGSAWGMLDIIRELPEHFASRGEAAKAITAAGYAPGVGQWMSSNLRRAGDRFVWQLNFDAMDALMRSFFATELWSEVESPAPDHTLHFLKASESSVLSADAVARLERASPGQVFLHHRTGGHWIHSEAPDVVTELLSGALPR